MNKQLIIVPDYVSADDANRLYGEQFGVDWKYEAITADTLRKLSPPAQSAQVPADIADFVRGMHTLELYNASTYEPYFDINGNDMWCNTEDFARKDGEKFVRFLFGCAEFVKSQLNATPTAEPVAQAEGDKTLKFEEALAELIEAVDPSIENGDIFADAHAAALVALQRREPVPQGDAALPPLPEPMGEIAYDSSDVGDDVEKWSAFDGNQMHAYARAALAAQPRAVPDDAWEMSEVWVVQDETGLPIYCASYPEACHEHINDAINEHGIEEAKAWKVLRFGNYVFVPCRKCNSTRVALAAAPSPGEPS